MLLICGAQFACKADQPSDEPLGIGMLSTQWFRFTALETAKCIDFFEEAKSLEEVAFHFRTL